MKRKFLSGVLIIIFTCSLFGCKLSKKEQPVDSETRKSKPVSIENMNDKYYKVVIDYNSGYSSKEIGEFLGKEIKNNIPDYEKKADNYIKELVKASSEKMYISYSKIILKNLQKEYMEELDGLALQMSGGEEDIAGDGKLSRNEIYLMNSIVDTDVRPSACSAFSVYGSSTIDGKCITGRNLDWVPTEDLQSISTVTIFKHGDKSICSIGFAGFMGILTGFNQSKVFAAILDSPAVYTKSYDDVRSYPFDLRYSLENNKTIDTVADFMMDKGHNYFRDHLIFLSDPNTSKVVENDLRSYGLDRRRELRTEASELNQNSEWGMSDSIACVNSFMLNGNNEEGMKYKANIERWSSFKRLEKEKKSSFTYDDVKQIMSFTNPANGEPGIQSDGSIYNKGTSQSIIFKPEYMKLEVAFAPKGKKLPEKPVYVGVLVNFE
jgi:hypothetical protein